MSTLDWVQVAEAVQQALRFSQTTIVLVLNSVVEAAIERGIKSKMRPLSNTQDERLFEGYGPIATFSAKIDIGYALSVFDDKVLADLRVIKEIRNEFAHPERLVHFDDEALPALTTKFSNPPEKMKPIQLYISRIVECLERIEHGVTDEKLTEFLNSLREIVARLDAWPGK
jgi:DNA-binding MltR family transcriptional regulator